MVEPSASSSKIPRAESTTGYFPSEEIPIDPIAVVAKDNVDEVEVKTSDAEPTVPFPLSLHAMMETFMITQVADGQLLDELITKVAALRADFTEYRSAFPPLPPSNS